MTAKNQQNRPSVLWRPTLFIRTEAPAAGRWRAQYNDVMGYGPTPDKAMRDFDKAWKHPNGDWNMRY